MQAKLSDRSIQKNQTSTSHSQPNLLPEQTTENIEEYIQILVEHQLNCEKSGRYVEARQAADRIAELRQDLELQQANEIRIRHANEIDGIERAHLDEFNQFNKFWDQRMQEFDQEAQTIEQELIRRQSDELQKVHEELEKAIPLYPKYSSELLNLKRMEQHLAKQKNYTEAHQIQTKIQNLEKQENQNWSRTRQQKIYNQIKQLQAKQNNELNALRQRIICGQDEQRKNRSQELERLLQKYQNVKNELEIQHQMEFLAHQKLFKSKAQVGGTDSRVLASRGSRRQ